MLTSSPVCCKSLCTEGDSANEEHWPGGDMEPGHTERLFSIQSTPGTGTTTSPASSRLSSSPPDNWWYSRAAFSWTLFIDKKSFHVFLLSSKSNPSHHSGHITYILYFHLECLDWVSGLDCFPCWQWCYGSPCHPWAVCSAVQTLK